MEIDMKKIFILVLVLCIVLTLASCEVHFMGQSYDVEWWVIAAPVAIILILTFIIAGCIISKNEYICPSCKGAFYPAWWKGAFSVHINSARVFKCPHCGKRGFCKPRKYDL